MMPSQKLFTAFLYFCWLLMVIVQVAETRSMAQSPEEEEESAKETDLLPSMEGDKDLSLEGTDVVVEENPIRVVKRSITDELSSSTTINWKEIVSTLSLVIQKLFQSLYAIVKRFFDSYSQSIVSLFRDRVFPAWLFFSTYVLQHPTVRSALTNYSSSLEWRPTATALFEALVKLNHQPQHNNMPQ